MTRRPDWATLSPGVQGESHGFCVRGTGRTHARPARGRGVPLCAVVPLRSLSRTAPLVRARRPGADVTGQRRRHLLRRPRRRTPARAGTPRPPRRVDRHGRRARVRLERALRRPHHQSVREPRPGTGAAGALRPARHPADRGRGPRDRLHRRRAPGRHVRRGVRLQPLQAHRRQDRRLPRRRRPGAAPGTRRRPRRVAAPDPPRGRTRPSGAPVRRGRPARAAPGRRRARRRAPTRSRGAGGDTDAAPRRRAARGPPGGARARTLPLLGPRRHARLPPPARLRQAPPHHPQVRPARRRPRNPPGGHRPAPGERVRDTGRRSPGRRGTAAVPGAAARRGAGRGRRRPGPAPDHHRLSLRPAARQLRGRGLHRALPAPEPAAWFARHALPVDPRRADEVLAVLRGAGVRPARPSMVPGGAR